MLFNPLGSSGYNATTYNSTPNVSNTAPPTQNQLSNEEIEKQAALSRAKRLQKLLDQLNNVLDDAIEATPDSNEAAQMEADYVAYILARLSGAGEGLERPEGFGEFAEELNRLIDDVLRAWDALVNSDVAFSDEVAPDKVFQDLESVIAVLENIALRRMEQLIANNWYQQWREGYRNTMLDDIKESHFAEELVPLTSLAPDMDALQYALANTGENQGRLVNLLRDALEIKNPETQQPILNPTQQQAVNDLLSLLGENVTA